MRFDWHEYKVHGESLLASGSATPVECRVAMSRLYYWAYNASLVWAEAHDLRMTGEEKRREGHARLWRYYDDEALKARDPDPFLSIRDNGVALQEGRHIADYKADWPVAYQQACEALVQADALKKGLEALS